MGTITTGTGLISGIDIAGLIDQLIALEERPKQLVEQRNAVLTAQQTAFQDVNAKLLGLKFNVDSLTGSTTFDATTATTSNESVLTVSSGAGAVPGNYGFTVDRLVSSQQVLTKGFKDIDSTPVGTGTLTFEKGNARLDSKTLLSNLNGGAGVSRGLIRVTDTSGAVGLIDLSRAVTIDDVIQTINSATNVSVLASVNGDGLTLTDNTGLPAGNITVTDVGTTGTATSLGIVGTSATGTITGTDMNFLGDDTRLAAINDGIGIDIRDSSSEFTIYGGDNTAYTIDLISEVTLGEVIQTINTATGGAITAAIAADGVSLTLTDTGSGGANFRVEAGATGSTAAADLGLSGDDADGDKQINGNRIIAGINSKLLSKLNGGQGLGGTTALVSQLTVGTPLTDLFNGVGLDTSNNALFEMSITARDGTAKFFNFDVYNTAGDLVNAVNAAFVGGEITMSFSGNAFVITDNTGAGGNLKIAQPGTATAVTDLGLTIDAAVNSVTGIDTNPVPTLTTQSGAGQVSIQDRAGAVFTADLTAAKSVSDVITGINAAAVTAGAGITAALNRAGTGITVTDTTGGTGSLIVSDTTGATATNLNLAGTFAADEVDSGNLQYQYITTGTSLSSIGFVKGKVLITDSSGASATVSLQETEQTIADVLQDINGLGLAINARVNDNGDGIILEDTNAGTQSVAIKVEEAGSGTAASLGILGEATNPGDDLDGSFEKTVGYTSGTMTGATLLTALKSGNGIDFETANPDFSITTADGNSFNVDITAGDVTVQDLIDNINTASGGSVTVSIHADGTTLTLIDNTSGAGQLSFAALNGSSALSDLGFKDDNDGNGQTASGTLVQVTTLRDLADLINDADVGVGAAIINDGSAGAPFRLIFSAKDSGSAGAFVFDDGGANFKASTFSEAQDAVVFFGSTDPAKAQIITSTSNTLEGVIPGATIDLLATSDQPVQVTVAQDDQAAVGAAQTFVDGFNTLMTTIDTYDSFNSDTEERGLLLGDSALVQLKSRLYSSIITRSRDLSGSFTSLAEVGITVGSGATLKLDSAKFQAALNTDRDAVTNLFTFKETGTDANGDTVTTAKGVGVAIDELLERLTDTETGIIESRVASIDLQLGLNQDRIDQLDAALLIKRARLEAQFVAMERALAQLQGQSSALASFQPISFTSNSNSQ
jgi:flagellar hook-associated protein 2